ncbi:MAG TPA: c-type cytochrome [Solirubrobacterales bacterium]|jgi:mono/diheme cytochrome c family protein|nr:c-type cytochrome [Solirubrobacterales bacterium]
MSNETLFFICGGILAASAVTVSVIGLKGGDKFPGKWMPVIIIWFAAFAVLSGTFAVLHGKDESRDHGKEYAKASEEIQKSETTGPFEEAELEKAEEEKAESGESEESSESGESSEEENEASGEEAEAEQEGAAGEELEGEAEGSETAAGGNAEAGAVVFSENCSTCHGATGHGGNGGPDLTTMPLAQTEEGAIQQVTNGGGGMPPFGGVLSEEEIENVAAYVVHEIVGK